jgi:hypothetical protein
VFVPNGVSQHASTGSNSIHRELDKVKFHEFMGAMNDATVKVWLVNMVMCFTLYDYTSNMKIFMAVF